MLDGFRVERDEDCDNFVAESPLPATPANFHNMPRLQDGCENNRTVAHVIVSARFLYGCSFNEVDNFDLYVIEVVEDWKTPACTEVKSACGDYELIVSFYTATDVPL